MSIFVMLLLLTPTTLDGKEPEKIALPPIKLVSGGYWKQIPYVTLYETSVPIIFETTLVMPRNDTRTILLANKESTDKYCATLNYRIAIAPRKMQDRTHPVRLSKGFCSAESAVDSLLSNLTEHALKTNIKYLLYDNIDEDNVHSTRDLGLNFIGRFTGWCCGVATSRSVQDLAIKEAKITQVVSNLASNIHVDHQNIVRLRTNLNAYAKQVEQSFKLIDKHTRQLQREMRNLSVYFQQNAKKLAKQIFDIHIDQITSLYVNLNMLLIQENREIQNSCTMKRLLMLLVKPMELITQLKQLRTTLRYNKHTLGIPLRNIMEHYSLPITKCVFTDTRVVIHIRVPIRKIGGKLGLEKFQTVPFLWKNSTCTILHEPTYAVVQANQVHLITGNFLEACNPYANRLCYVPRYGKDATLGTTCPQKIQEGATLEELSIYCTFQCRGDTGILVTELSPDTYIITNPPKEIMTECNSKITSIPTHAELPGAVKIELLYNCNLQLSPTQIIPETYPCSANTKEQQKIRHILPAAWSPLSALKLANIQHLRETTEFQDFSYCLNKN